MAEQKSVLKICRVCLEVVKSDNAAELNPKQGNLFILLNLELDPLPNDKFFLCSSCSVQLHDNVDFKMGCLKNIVYCEKLESDKEAEESKTHICKLCLEIWEIGDLILANSETEASILFDNESLIKCFSEVSFAALRGLLICPSCLEFLKKLSSFLKSCLESNEIIKGHGILNVFDLLRYKLNQKKSSDEDRNLREIELENQEDNIISKAIKEELTIEESDLMPVKTENHREENSGFHINFDTVSATDKKGKQYVCYHCQFQTHVRATLILHLLVHQNTDVQTFKCDSCDFVSKWRTSLHTHKLLHKKSNEVKTYKCKMCKYQSIYRKHLRRHMEHCSEKIYCDKDPSKIKKRGRKARKKQKLHKKIDIMPSELSEDFTLKTNKVKKNYKCSYCPYETEKCYRIKEHISKHLGDDEVTWYRCEICDFKSRYKASLNHHQKLHTEKKTIKPKKSRNTKEVKISQSNQ